MAYTRNIPMSTDLISNSQGQIQANFNAIDSGTTGTGKGFSRNHVTLTDSTNGGLHSQVDFFVAISPPSLAGVSSLYPKTVGSNVELSYKNAAQDLQLTGPHSSASPGYVTLPGGILMQWGSVDIEDGDTQSNNVTFPVAFTSEIFTLVANPSTTVSADAEGVGWAAAGTGLNKFFLTRNGTHGTTSQYWIAIGV